jgi:hypothetical protein
MAGQLLRDLRRRAAPDHAGDERMPERMEVRVAALGIDVGQEVALLCLRSLEGILEAGKPSPAGLGQV